MDEKNFRVWLEKQKNYHTARTYAARCMRIETELKIDLDREYAKDGGKMILARLKYSREEQRQNRPPECGLKFGDSVDIYTGMNSLRASVKKYFEFKSNEV